jgi:hypothetical protein
MKSGIKHGKRGRPKKVQPKVDAVTPKPLEYVIKKDGVEIDMNQPLTVDISPIKRGRGRPPKSGVIKGEMNITIKPQSKGEIISTEDYVQPQILRKKRVFRFDKRLFHQFAQKYNGDIVIMSYVHDRMMQMFLNGKIKIPTIDETYYHEWCKMTPPIEPVTEKEISSDNAFMRGIPVQYKYSLLIDEDMFWRFEKGCKRYPQFISNELLKQMLNEGIEIDTSKYREWCTV